MTLEAQVFGLRRFLTNGQAKWKSMLSDVKWSLPLLLAVSLLAPRQATAQTSALVVDGAVERTLNLSLDDLRSMDHRRIEIDEQGRRATYEGVPLAVVLRRAGLEVGRAPLHGRPLVSVVFVTAVDGYQVVFAVAEFDPASTDRPILLADARDGHPLSGNEGPLRIVAPGDNHPARWVRQVVRLTVVVVTSPKPQP